MEENRKRQGGEDDGEEGAVAVKRTRTPPTSDDEDIKALLSNEDDETASHELAKLLDTEALFPVKVRFIEYPYYFLPLIFQTASSYVTINGNEESCGSSYSEMESSVMAGIDIVRRGIVDFCDVDGWLSGEDGGAWLNDGEVARGEAEAEAACDTTATEGFDQVKQTNGWDCLVIDDEMLARFIGDDHFE